MARSSYVYLVTAPHVIVATFTVKHELTSWLRRQGRVRLRYRIFRFVDSPRDVVDPVEITNEFSEVLLED